MNRHRTAKRQADSVEFTDSITTQARGVYRQKSPIGAIKRGGLARSTYEAPHQPNEAIKASRWGQFINRWLTDG